MDGLGPSCGMSKGKLRPTSSVRVRTHCHPGQTRRADYPTLSQGREMHWASGTLMTSSTLGGCSRRARVHMCPHPQLRRFLWGQGLGLNGSLAAAGSP